MGETFSVSEHGAMDLDKLVPFVPLEESDSKLFGRLLIGPLLVCMIIIFVLLWGFLRIFL